VLRGRESLPKTVKAPPARAVKRFQALKRAHALLQEEHALIPAQPGARGVRQSMTRGGAPGENAHIESFFHSFKADVVHGRRSHTLDERRRELRWYLPFYNRQRLHSALGSQSPIDYERRAA